MKYAQKYLDDSDIELLLAKPDIKEIKNEEISILCSHGSHISSTDHIGIMTSTERMERLTEELKTDILLCGHTHLPYNTSYNKKIIINAGSVGLSKDGDSRASYGIIDVSKDGFSYENCRVRYDIDKTIKEAIENKFPGVENYVNMLRNTD